MAQDKIDFRAVRSHTPIMGNIASTFRTFKKRTSKKRTFSSLSTEIRSEDESEIYDDIEPQSSEIVLHIWLNTNINENLQIQKAVRVLKKNIKNVLVMNDPCICKQWLMKHHVNETIALIVSSECGKQVVPDIHHSQSIIAIYVYCSDDKVDNKWTKKYSKVRGVFSDPNKLAQQVSIDMKDFNYRYMYPNIAIRYSELSRVEDVLETKEESRGGMYQS